LSKSCNVTTCEAEACDDGIQNGTETGVDCGGSCVASDSKSCAICDPPGTPCVATTHGCKVDADCLDDAATVGAGLCQDGFCRIDACGNAILDGGEVGAQGDCSAPNGSCGACPVTHDCTASNECASGLICDIGTTDDCIADPCLTTCGASNGCPACDLGSTCDPAQTDCDTGLACTDCIDADPICTGLENACGTNTTVQGCKVNAALGQFYAKDPRVKTFVVGFASFAGGASPNLNCHAANGRTLRSEAEVAGCGALDTTNCSVNNIACYYDAADQAALSAAFTNIIGQVATCTYDLSTIPIDLSKTQVFLQDVSGGDPSYSPLDFGAANDWIYRGGVNQLEVVGQACQDILGGSGNLNPVVVFPCDGGF